MASTARSRRATCSSMPLRYLFALPIAVLNYSWINGVLAAPLGSCYGFDYPSLAVGLSHASSCLHYYLLWFDNMDPHSLSPGRS